MALGCAAMVPYRRATRGTSLRELDSSTSKLDLKLGCRSLCFVCGLLVTGLYLSGKFTGIALVLF